MSLSASIAGLRPEIWRKQLFADVRDNLYMARFMGDSEQSMIQELTDLKAAKGFKINFGLGMKLSGAGITGDSTLEGSEEAMADYEEEVAIDQLRWAVRLTGAMDEKQNAYDMRVSAKNRLADWIAERIEKEIMDKLCGKASSTFSNTPSAAASGRSVFAGGQSTTGGITTAMKFDCKMIDKAVQTAKLADPMVRPLKINGKEHYVLILHPYDATNLRQDPVWAQAQRDANVRGEENPIFSGALGMYNGVIVHEHEYVYRTNDGSGSVYVSRNVFCGQQAAVFAWGKNVSWVEKSFDYENSWGVSCGAIFGVIKPIFNSVDYGAITMFAYSAAASTA
jgi:N4-gp56 family major capsid protein